MQTLFLRTERMLDNNIRLLIFKTVSYSVLQAVPKVPCNTSKPVL